MTAGLACLAPMVAPAAGALPGHAVTATRAPTAATAGQRPGTAAPGLPAIGSLRAGRAGVGLPAAPRRWAPPVRPVRVVRAFQPPAHDWLPGHRGVDLHARPGQSVSSAGTGRITYAGRLAGRGVVVVDHGTLRTTYEPVAATVEVGQRVSTGDEIGRVAPGSGHCGSGDCLHLGLKRGSVYLDPRFLILGMRTVLRPL